MQEMYIVHGRGKVVITTTYTQGLTRSNRTDWLQGMQGMQAMVEEKMEEARTEEPQVFKSIQ
jgi:hypothetical protein